MAIFGRFLTPVSTVRVPRTIRELTAIASPSILTNTLVSSTVTLSMPSTIYSNPWTTRIFTICSTPSNVTLTHVINNRSMLRTFAIAPYTDPTWFTIAVTAVHWNLLTVCARIVASRSHPPLGAVLTLRRIHRGVAYPSLKAVRGPRTVGDFAATAGPAFVTSADVSRRVAHAMACAV